MSERTHVPKRAIAIFLFRLTIFQMVKSQAILWLVFFASIQATWFCRQRRFPGRTVQGKGFFGKRFVISLPLATAQSIAPIETIFAPIGNQLIGWWLSYKPNSRRGRQGTVPSFTPITGTSWFVFSCMGLIINFWKHRTLTGKHCRVKYPGLLDPNEPDKTWEYGECPGACPGHLNQRNKNKFPHIYWQFNSEQCCAFDEDTK